MTSIDWRTADVHPEILLAELNGLIELAEESTNRIDYFNEYIEKRQINAYGFFAAGVLFTGISVITITISFNILHFRFGFGTPDNILLAAASSMATVMAFFAYYVAYTRARIINRNRRSAFAEMEIHQRLMSLIDQQKSRLDGSGHLSPVASATLDMRIMRMQRSLDGFNIRRV